MSSADILAREAAHDSGVFPKRPLALVRGEGATVWDAEGRAYVDCGASYGAMNVGHCHPRVVAALKAQADQLWFAGQTYGNDRRAELLEKLVALAPRDVTRAFLANSGAEAVEAAIKFARGVTGRSRIVAFRNGFHGRTTGALSLTWRPQYREPFGALLPDVEFVRYGDEEAVKNAVTSETAAVFFEPVQGEGGVRPAPPGFLRTLRDVTTDAGALLVADEIQTGFGRTGRMWGVDHEHVVPDALCVAKSIAGGFPMGALLLREDAARLPPSSHGNTFGGSALACAAASATLDVLVEERLAERADALGARLVEGLAAHVPENTFREIRGRGLMVGMELRSRAGGVLDRLTERGVLALPAGKTVLRYLPPLVITEAQVDAVVEATAKAVSEAAA